MFVAFYSFKGGVGRSMALINSACLLAGHGRRVLAIDLDLEAPGISYLLQREKPDAKPTKGFVDFIYDLLSQGEKSPLVLAGKQKAFLKYTSELHLPESLQRKPGGVLRIMPAGRIDSGYEKRRQAIDIHRLYLEQKGEPIIRHLRNLIIESGQFDYVLIDSRTGFADEAGISVRDLADHLIVLHGLNHQNLEGTARFLERLKDRVSRLDEMKIAFVASPIPLGEDDLCERRIQAATECFSKSLKRPVQVDLQIPYHPRLALDETPFIFRRTQGALHKAYGDIEHQIRLFNADTSSEWSNRFRKYLKEENADGAIECIKKLATLDDERAKFQARRAVDESTGKELFEQYWDFYVSKVGRDVSSLSAAIEHYKKTEQKDRVENIYREMLPLVSNDADKLNDIARFFWHDRMNASEAERLFKQALKISPQNARILCNFGTFEQNQRKNYKQAAQLYRRAILAKPEYSRANILLGIVMEDHGKKYAAAEKQYRAAITKSPQDSGALRRLAWLLEKRKRKLDEAERLMRRSVEYDKQNPGSVGSLATFLWRSRGNYPDARKLYNRALALDPSNDNNTANFAGFLLARGDMEEAGKQILEAWALCCQQPSQVSAEILFYRCVWLKLHGKADMIPLGHLKHLFIVGYERGQWWFDDVLRRLNSRKISSTDFQFYTALSNAILNNSKVKQLDAYGCWSKVKALPLAKTI